MIYWIIGFVYYVVGNVAMARIIGSFRSLTYLDLFMNATILWIIGPLLPLFAWLGEKEV